MMNGMRVGQIFGLDIVLDWSLIIIVVLVTVSLGAGVFPGWHPDWSGGLTWVVAFAAALLLMASVLIHELSHALVGRAQGMRIERIVLFVFGGMAQFEHEPHRWRTEFWMAIVGPFTSLALGLVFLFIGGLLVDATALDPEHPERALSRMGPVATLLFWAGPVNIILAVFNLVPGFPLDGGRVLRALLWGATGDLRKATRWASGLGQAFAWFLIAAGIGMMFGLRLPVFGTGLIGGVWIAFIGWFLNNAALMSYRQLLVKESLENVPVSRLMYTDIVAVPAGLSIETLVNEYIMRRDQRAYPVMEDDRLAGLVCLQDVRAVARDRWGDTSVREVMTPVESVATVSPQDEASEVMWILNRRVVNQVPVVERGEVKGFVRREDILKWLALHGDEKIDSALPT